MVVKQTNKTQKNRATNFCKDYPEPDIGSRRQDFQECFIRNGLCYVMSRNCILNHKNIYGENFGYCITKRDIVNIDTLSDLERATDLMSER